MREVVNAGDLLSYRHKKYAEYVKAEDLAKLKFDAERMKDALAGLESEKRGIDERIDALRQSQLRLMKFLEQFTG